MSNAKRPRPRLSSTSARRALARIAGVMLALGVSAGVARGDEGPAPTAGASGVQGEGATGAAPDPLTGTFRWTYPFELPAARGVSRSLGLSYGSSSTDGEGGYGWHLDIPRIERAPLSAWPEYVDDGTVEREDRYAFDGAPLVFICVSGDADCVESASNGFGLLKAEAMPTWAAGWRYYRLQDDHSFSRFFLSPDRLTWRVQWKGGDVWELGRPLARADLGTGDGIDYAALDDTPAGPPKAHRWSLVRQYDLHGVGGEPVNLVAYRWAYLGNRSLRYLTDVFDTPPAASAGSAPLDAFAHHAQLTWSPAPSQHTTYAPMNRARPDLVLTHVGVSAAAWSTPAGPREVIRAYHLRYRDPRSLAAYDPLQQSPLWGHEFLREIQEETRCGTPESGGAIPTTLACATLEPTRFRYETGELWTGITRGPAPMPGRSGGDTLPNYPRSMLVDLNHDGLPDLVEGFDHEWSTPGGPTYAVDLVERPNTRKMHAYFNHSTDAGFHLDHACMDGGGVGGDGVASKNHLKTRGFATRDSGKTQAVPFGDHPLAWWVTDQRVYCMRRVINGADFGCIESTISSAPFLTHQGDVIGVPTTASSTFCDEGASHAAWRWHVDPLPTASTPSTQWTRIERGLRSFDWSAGDAADVDGDGLPDAARVPALEPENSASFERGVWHFSRRLPASRPRPAFVTDPDHGTLVTEPARVAVEPVHDYQNRLALDLVVGAPTYIVTETDHSRYPLFNGERPIVLKDSARAAFARSFYVDMNGDGLADYVYAKPTYINNSNYWTAAVMPGNGRGGMRCQEGKQPFPCAASTLEPGTFIPKHYDLVFTDVTPYFDGQLYFHDVTGDGLADAIELVHDGNNARVRLWINTDGRTMQCVSPGNNCEFGYFASPESDAELTFADMDGSGVDEIVLKGRQGLYIMPATIKRPRSANARAPRPGLLTLITSPSGAISEINYASVQELDSDANDPSDPMLVPWKFHSPRVSFAVTKIVTGIPGGANYGGAREVRYSYRDPAYNPWDRQLRGFSKVRVSSNADPSVTETSYWFSACDRGTVFDPAAPDGLSAEGGAKGCPQTSDDDTARMISGAPVRIDRFVPTGGEGAVGWLETQVYSYERRTIARTRDRTVRADYARSVSTYVYDTAVPTSAGTIVSAPDGTAMPEPLRAQSGRVQTVQSTYQDAFGTVIRTVAHGAGGETQIVTDLSTGASPHEVSIHAPQVDLPCDENWLCLPTLTEVHAIPAGATQPVGPPLRRVETIYDAYGDLGWRLDWLSGSRTLERSPVYGVPGPTPPDAAAGAYYQVTAYSRDAFGNVTRATSGSKCADVVFDDYAMFPKETRVFTQYCDSPAPLTTMRAFDRGFQAPTLVVEPSGARWTMDYDPQGRPKELHAPDPDVGMLTVSAMKWTYHDATPLSWVDIDRRVGTDAETHSVEIVNAVGEPVLAFDQADIGVGWIARGWVARDNAGRVIRAARPFAFGGDPGTVAANATPLVGNQGERQIAYDNFGRPSFAYEDSVLVQQTVYRPLVTETRDAEQSKAGGPHTGARTITTTDGHGRVVSVAKGFPGTDVLTNIAYGVDGSVEVQRTNGPSTFVRRLEHDTFGRVVLNLEPNTHKAGDLGADGRPKGWRYVYDSDGNLAGTSDARGCGVDYYYDYLGRPLFEDYSPCTAEQAPYTVPSWVDAEGTEVYYHYDDYAPGQMASTPDFTDRPELATGRLVGVTDRGGRNRFNYDARGRMRRTTRQIAKTDAAWQPTVDGRYAPRWYTQETGYDLANRVTWRSTGTELPELLVEGMSREAFTYTARDLVANVGSSYGPVISGTTYSPAGEPLTVTYGDAAATRATTTWDTRGRMQTARIDRAPATVWTNPTGSYTAPPAETTVVDLANMTFSYDELGHPTAITDIAAGWHAGAKPVTRTASYDEHYRVTHLAYSYLGVTDVQASPFAAEIASGDHRHVPVREAGGDRVNSQSFSYDFMGNTTHTDDDRHKRFDRSLGAITHSAEHPNQLTDAEGVHADYDESGNVLSMTVERDTCTGAGTSMCTHRFVYDWDEVGQLMRARRWDYPAGPIPAMEPAHPDVPTSTPAWDLRFGYSMGARVLKTATDALGVERHTLEVFDTLRVNHAELDAQTGDYDVSRHNTSVYVGGLGRVAYDSNSVLPSPSGDQRHMFLILGDHLGSASFVLDAASGEVVERTSYQAYGAVESDFRPDRWAAFREDYRFTGKEEDVEVGVTYFGARYYQAQLGRWMSADPLAIHAMGADLNPYAYVGGDVLGSVDPLGLQGVSAGGGARYEGGVLHMPAVNIHARPPRALTAKPVVIVAPRPALAPQSHGHAVNGQLPLEKALRAFRIFGGFMAADAVDLGSKLAQPGAFVTGQGVARGAVSAASPAAGAVINHVAPAPNPKDAGPEVGSFGVNYVLPAVTGAAGARAAGATPPRNVAASIATDIQPAQILREIQHGERIADIMAEVNSLRETTGLEYAVVSRTTGGPRVLVYGGSGGIEFSNFPIKRILGHSHPIGFSTPSRADFMLLQSLGQRSSWIYENTLMRFGVRPAAAGAR